MLTALRNAMPPCESRRPAASRQGAYPANNASGQGAEGAADPAGSGLPALGASAGRVIRVGHAKLPSRPVNPVRH